MAVVVVDVAVAVAVAVVSGRIVLGAPSDAAVVLVESYKYNI
jgi:hypothetical protein